MSNLTDWQNRLKSSKRGNKGMTEDQAHYGSEETKTARLDRLLAELDEINARRQKLIEEITRIVEE